MSLRRNLFTAGIVVGPAGGAFVVVEKCPRPSARPAQRRAPRRHLGDGAWEDVLEIAAAERLSGRMTDMLDAAADFLRHPPLLGDCSAFVETALLGDTLGRLLADRDAGVGRFVLGGDGREKHDPTTGAWTVPLATLQARVMLLFETKRLLVGDEVDAGPGILRSLERLGALPETGTMRDLAIAAAIAAWAADSSPSGGPWASAEEPPEGSPEAAYFEEQAALRALAAEEREARRERRRWRGLGPVVDEESDGFSRR